MDSKKTTKAPLSLSTSFHTDKKEGTSKKRFTKKPSQKSKIPHQTKEKKTTTKSKENHAPTSKRSTKETHPKRPKETAASIAKRKNLVSTQNSETQAQVGKETTLEPTAPSALSAVPLPLVALPFSTSSTPKKQESQNEAKKIEGPETQSQLLEKTSSPNLESEGPSLSPTDCSQREDFSHSKLNDSSLEKKENPSSLESEFSTLFFQSDLEMDSSKEKEEEFSDNQEYLFLEEANDLDFQENDPNATFLERGNKEKEEVVVHRPQYKEQILELIRTINAPLLLSEQLDDYHANDIADAIEDLNYSEREKLYRMLDIERLTEILEYMDEEEQAKHLNEMNIRKVIAIFNQMEPDKAADILKEMGQEKIDIILELLHPEVHRKISIIFSYKEDEIGSKMTTNYIEVPKNITVKEATERLIEQAVDNDNISTIYVQDENGMYYGAVALKDLIVSKAATPLEDIIATSYPYVYAKEAIDRVVEELKDYNEDSIPVLNNNNTLVGVITSQDLLEVMDEEMGEDYAKLAGLAGEEDLEESISESLRKRLPWLITLLFLGLLVSMVVALFEGVVAKLTLVMAFQSLILGMSGNVGTQSLAVTIRVLMDESLDRKQKFFLIGKEIRVGFANGLLIGFFAFCFLGLYIHFFKGYIWSNAYAISLCVGVALWISMIISSLTGTVFPLFFKKIGVDPAVASGPLITTINDMVGVVTYYGLAWIFLIQILHLH